MDTLIYMKRYLVCTLTLIILTLLCLASHRTLVQAQQPASLSSPDKSVDVERIIRAFTAKETEFRRALNQYAFKRDAVIQTIGQGGQISGEYRRVSTFTFDDQGNRYEKINFFPMSTLTEISVTAEDLEDLGGIQPFALEASKIDQYNFKYIGKERIDELDLYVFDVTPKVIPDPKKSKKRLFQGRIWVDDRDLEIVKVRGKGVPETKNNKYPTFDTYREQIDGRYWFPTYTYADEDLEFSSGQVVHVRMRVKYSDFEQARGKVRILDPDDPTTELKTEPTPAPSPTASPSKTKKPLAPLMEKQ